MSNLTPEGFRTAAYLAAKARMDFRQGKTRGQVHCTPPNTKCGNRCIPPSWDCRLKGEGPDPHLAAKRTDPISGFANIERGFKRLGKFARTGSFSELESGKRSLVRGAVKLKPGDLKAKNDFKQWLENNYLKIAVPLFIAGGAISAHSILKAGNTFGYREGFGRKVDNAVSTGIGRVLDVIPGIGQARAYTRSRAAAAASANMRRTATGAARDRMFVRNPESGIPDTAISPTLIKGSSDLTAALRKVNEQKSANSFYEWNTKHRQAFWGASHSAHNLAGEERDLIGKSIFAEPTAQAYLNKEWGLGLPARATRPEYINALSGRIATERDAYLQLAKQQGFRVQGRPGAEFVHRDDHDAFVTRAISGITDETQRRAQSAYVSALVRVGAPSTRARAIYDENVAAYDTYYKKVAQSVERVAGAPDYDSDMAAEGLVAIRRAAERRRVDYLMVTSKKPRKSSAGPAHDRLFLLDYYHTRVAGSPKSTYTISADDAIRVASELSGNPVRTGQEAIELLNSSEHGYKGAQLEQRRDPFQRAPRERPTPGGGEPRPNRRVSDAQRIANMMRRKNPDGSPVFATREAAEAELRRLKRQDADEVRTEAYLHTRERLDKRCGKSGIPNDRKCSKNTPMQSENAKKRERGKALTGVTCFSPNQKCGDRCIPSTQKCELTTSSPKLGTNIAKTALVAGTLIGAGFAAKSGWRNRQSIANAFARHNPKAYDRVSRQVQHYRNLYKQAAPVISNNIVDRLSHKDIQDGIARLPKQFQQPVQKLVGRVKTATVHMSLYAQDYELKHVDTKNNFSTFVRRDGSVSSVGAINNDLLTFNSTVSRQATDANNNKINVYGVQFTVNNSMTRQTRASNEELKKKTLAMWNRHLQDTSKDALMYSVPFDDDGRGAARSTAYTRWGFTKLPGLDDVQPWDGFNGNVMFALKSDGKITKMNDDYKHYITNVLATVDHGKYRGEVVPRSKSTAKPYKTPKLKTQTGAKPSTNAPKVKRTNPSEWADLPDHGHLDERHRERRYDVISKAKPVDTETLASRFEAAKRHQGVVPQNIERLASFTRKNKITIEHNSFDNAAGEAARTGTDSAYWSDLRGQIKKGYSYSGMYFQSNAGQNSLRNRIYVSPKRSNLDSWEDASSDAVRTVNEFMDNVANHNVPTFQNKGQAKSKEAFLYQTTYNAASNGDAHDLLVATHETGHAIHEKTGFRKIDVSPTVESELMKVSSAYGLSDVGAAQKELFSELFVLYTYQGDRLRKEAPNVYAWIDSVAGEVA